MGLDIMLSESIASVERLVSACGKYRAQHRRHKCNSCGLYGHIAADCLQICENCGGKHLRKHCIAFIADQLKTLINSLSNSFVRDYNRTKNILNVLESRPVVYTHVVPDSCCRLNITNSNKRQPTVCIQKKTTSVWADVSSAYSSQPLRKRIFTKLTGDMNTDAKWVSSSVLQYAGLQIPSLKWEKVPGENTVTSTNCTFSISPKASCMRRHHEVTSDRCINLTSFEGEHRFILFSIDYQNEIRYTNKPTITMRRGNDLQVVKVNYKKTIDSLRHKLRSYNALAADFESINRMTQSLKSLQKMKLEYSDKLKCIAEKFANLHQKYTQKKSEAITSLKEKTTAIFNHEKNRLTGKLKHLKNKLNVMQQKLDDKYNEKSQLYKPKVKHFIMAERSRQPKITKTVNSDDSCGSSPYERHLNGAGFYHPNLNQPSRK